MTLSRVVLSLSLLTVLVVGLLPAAAAAEPACTGTGTSEVCAGTYSDESTLRGGLYVSVDAARCHTAAWTIWFDSDGDGLPDALPPGGPPPGYDAEHVCLR